MKHDIIKMSHENPYDVIHASEEDRSLLPNGFRGSVFRLSNRWKKAIEPIHAPLSILDLCTQQGANACSLLKTFAIHPETMIYCVDRWNDPLIYSDWIQSLHLIDQYFVENIRLMLVCVVGALEVHPNS